MKKVKKPPHISQADWDDLDIPELTDEDFKRFRPAREVDPELVAAYERGDLHRRGKQKKPTKKLVSLRLSPDVLRHFKATGTGWQTRLDAALCLLIGARE